MNLLAFPVQPVRSPFSLTELGENFYPFRLPRYSVNWSSNDPGFLSEALNAQIRNNLADFVQLTDMCRDPEFKDQLWTALYDEETDEVEILRDYYTTQQKKEDSCRKFLSRLAGYQDTLARDSDVFNQKRGTESSGVHAPWNVLTYAIVLLYHEEYFGHIYAWLSPVNRSTCFGMGIRGRVDSVFREDDLKNLSGYLLEGVRRFGLAKGCQTMVIPKPLPVMEEILKKIGFRRRTLLEERVGRSLAFPAPSPSGICFSCYHSSLDRPFVDAPVNFELYA